MSRVYAILARELALPAHFGRNLDALWDSLTGDVEGPFAIVVEDTRALEAALGAKGAAFVTLLRDLRHARADATVTLKKSRG
jgi:ribonuclease inhibitor